MPFYRKEYECRCPPLHKGRSCDEINYRVCEKRRGAVPCALAEQQFCSCSAKRTECFGWAVSWRTGGECPIPFSSTYFCLRLTWSIVLDLISCTRQWHWSIFLSLTGLTNRKPKIESTWIHKQSKFNERLLQVFTWKVGLDLDYTWTRLGLEYREYS